MIMVIIITITIHWRPTMFYARHKLFIVITLFNPLNVYIWWVLLYFFTDGEIVVQSHITSDWCKSRIWTQLYLSLITPSRYNIPAYRAKALSLTVFYFELYTSSVKQTEQILQMGGLGIRGINHSRPGTGKNHSQDLNLAFYSQSTAFLSYHLALSSCLELYPRGINTIALD